MNDKRACERALGETQTRNMTDERGSKKKIKRKETSTDPQLLISSSERLLSVTINSSQVIAAMIEVYRQMKWNLASKHKFRGKCDQASGACKFRRISAIWSCYSIQFCSFLTLHSPNLSSKYFLTQYLSSLIIFFMWKSMRNRSSFLTHLRHFFNCFHCHQWNYQLIFRSQGITGHIG